MRPLLLLLALSSTGFAAERQLIAQAKTEPPIKFAVEGPPRIVTVPASSPGKTPAVDPAQPLALSVDRFVFILVPTYEGSITFDVTGDSCITSFPVKPGTPYPGKLQGGTAATLNVAPDSKSDVLMVFGETVGTVQITAWGVANAKAVKLDTKVITVAPIVPDKPVPQPQPPPVPPTPAPSPAGQTGAWVVAVADEANMTAAQGKIVDGPTLRALKAAGKCRVYGSVTDAAELTKKGYAKLIADSGITGAALLILDKTGHKVAAVALPMDETSIAAKLKETMLP